LSLGGWFLEQLDGALAQVPLTRPALKALDRRLLQQLLRQRITAAIARAHANPVLEDRVRQETQVILADRTVLPDGRVVEQQAVLVYVPDAPTRSLLANKCLMAIEEAAAEVLGSRVRV